MDILTSWQAIVSRELLRGLASDARMAAGGWRIGSGCGAGVGGTGRPDRRLEAERAAIQGACRAKEVPSRAVRRGSLHFELPASSIARNVRKLGYETKLELSPFFSTMPRSATVLWSSVQHNPAELVRIPSVLILAVG